MTVFVRIFGGLQRHTQGISELTLEVDPGTTAWDIVIRLGIPENEVWFAAVGGIRVPREHLLKQHDKVDIFAPVGGG
ncbi:MAG TPA: MoaD/ThiS family protein [Bacillota bacterium]|nr:MoaD/ThiS family protein [Bacillota bacterium]